jgi:hypothetical protein
VLSPDPSFSGAAGFRAGAAAAAGAFGLWFGGAGDLPFAPYRLALPAFNPVFLNEGAMR